MSINSRIKQLRLDKGLKQGEAAIAIGITQRMLSAIEVGDNQPTIDSLAKIATYYSVTTDYLIFGDSVAPTSLERDILKDIREDKAVYNALITRLTAKQVILSSVTA